MPCLPTVPANFEYVKQFTKTNRNAHISCSGISRLAFSGYKSKPRTVFDMRLSLLLGVGRFQLLGWCDIEDHRYRSCGRNASDLGFGILSPSRHQASGAINTVVYWREVGIVSRARIVASRFSISLLEMRHACHDLLIWKYETVIACSIGLPSIVSGEGWTRASTSASSDCQVEGYIAHHTL